MDKILINEKINILRKTSIENFQSNYFLTQIGGDCITFENNNAILFLSKEKHFYKLFYAFIDLSSFEKRAEIYASLCQKGVFVKTA